MARSIKAKKRRLYYVTATVDHAWKVWDARATVMGCWLVRDSTQVCDRDDDKEVGEGGEGERRKGVVCVCAALAYALGDSDMLTYSVQSMQQRSRWGVMASSLKGHYSNNSLEPSSSSSPDSTHVRPSTDPASVCCFNAEEDSSRQTDNCTRDASHVGSRPVEHRERRQPSSLSRSLFRSRAGGKAEPRGLHICQTRRQP